MKDTQALPDRNASGGSVSTLFGTTAQRVLSIPELLELIFSFLEKKENAMNVLVCKRWSEVAMDLLWRNVDDPHVPRLFRLLGPIEECVKGHRFSKPLEPSNWTRFMRYASRVRTLAMGESIDTNLRGSLVFDEIAQTRTTLNVFPKLTSLAWVPTKVDRLRLSVMFMTENIKDFSALIGLSDSYSLSVYFEEIKLRMPKLTTLDLRFTFPVREIETDLCKLFSALPKLQTVILPKFTLTTKVIETLSRSPHLGVVQFEFLEGQGSGDAQDVATWAPTLEEDAFPALYDFSVSVELADTLPFLRSRFFPAQLRILFVHALHTAAPAHVHDFLAAVAHACPQLAELHLDFAGDPYASTLSFDPAHPARLTWDTLRPVLRCARLTAFDLRWDTPPALAQADVEELAASWPALEDLKLCPDPAPYPDSALLSLRALIPFARHCPNLRELGLYMAASAADTHGGDEEERAGPASGSCAKGGGVGAADPLPRFRSLKKLFVGHSSITEVEPVALFLSRLCPAGCAVVPGTDVPTVSDTMEVATDADAAVLAALLPAVERSFELWEEVNRALPLLTRVRAEERARRAALEREVDDLRVRCGVLEGRLGMGEAAAAGVDGGCMIL